MFMTSWIDRQTTNSLSLAIYPASQMYNDKIYFILKRFLPVLLQAWVWQSATQYVGRGARGARYL
jgi:hypothetical protein